MHSRHQLACPTMCRHKSYPIPGSAPAFCCRSALTCHLLGNRCTSRVPSACCRSKETRTRCEDDGGNTTRGPPKKQRGSCEQDFSVAQGVGTSATHKRAERETREHTALAETPKAEVRPTARTAEPMVGSGVERLQKEQCARARRRSLLIEKQRLPMRHDETLLTARRGAYAARASGGSCAPPPFSEPREQAPQLRRQTSHQHPICRCLLYTFPHLGKATEIQGRQGLLLCNRTTSRTYAVRDQAC